MRIIGVWERRREISSRKRGSNSLDEYLGIIGPQP